jgi:Tfp pilus assembly protein PilF
MDLGRYEEAIADMSQSIKLDPKDTLAYVLRGLVYQSDGKEDLAFDDFSYAIKLNPTLAVLTWHAA